MIRSPAVLSDALLQRQLFKCERYNIKICIQSLGKEAKIEELKNHLKKLFLKSIIFSASRSVTGNEIQHIEGLIRPTRKQPKPSILSFLGF